MRRAQAAFLHRTVRVFTALLIFLCAMFLSFFLLSQAVSADDWQDASEDILEYVSDAYQSEYGSAPENINIVNKDTEKIYVDVDLSAGTGSTYKDLADLCRNAPVVYSVPVEADGIFAVVEVSRGLPLNESASDLLTEEERQKIVENEGKWTPVSVFFEKNYKSLNRKIRDILNQNGISADTSYLLLGGIPGIHQVMIAADADPDCVFLPLDSVSLTETDFSSDADSAQNQADANVREMYSLEELRKIAESNQSNESRDAAWELREENGNVFGIIILAVCIAGFVSFSAFLYFRKRRPIS